MATWEIHKAEDGGSFWLQVGYAGVPGSYRVEGLTRAQAANLGDALMEVERVTRYETLATVRAAIGL